MRMTLEALRQCAQTLQRVDIVSIEGHSYMARLWLEPEGDTASGLRILCDERLQSLLCPSSAAMNRLLDEYGVRCPRQLIHHCAYSEMVGLEGGVSEPLVVDTGGRL